MSSHEGRALAAANQLELWTAPGEGGGPIEGLRVVRRDGRESAFDLGVLSQSILRAGWPGEALDADTVASLSRAVQLYLEHSNAEPVTVSTLRETVERLLVDMGYTLTARMYAGAFAPTPAADADTGMFDEPLPIDRAERLLAAAAADGGLDRDSAEKVVAEILRQIAAAGVRQLRPGLLREWMGAELHARGLSGAASKLARLSMPVSALHDAFAETEGAPIISPADPEAAALALAGRVSAAYVLGQLLPAAVGQAHVRGDIQVRGIGNFLRLDSIAMHLEGLKEHGPLMAGGPQATADDAKSLAASLSAQGDTFARFFGGEISWSAINFGFAPYLAGRSDDEIQTTARAALMGTFVRAQTSSTRGATTELRFTWDAPDEFPSELIGPKGTRIPLPDCYGDARKFLGASLAALAEMSENGWPQTPLRVSLHLSPYFFGAPDSEGYLECVGRIASGTIPLALRYTPAAPLMFDDSGARGQAEIVAQTVSLSAVRAAKLASGPDAFLARLDAAVDTAAAAHRAKRVFIEHVLNQRGGPLALLQRSYGGGPFAPTSAMRYRVGVSGLSRAALARAGVRWMAPGEELATAEAALDRLRQSCARWTAGTGQHFVLAGTGAGHGMDTSSDRAGLRPKDAITLEGQLHPYYDLAPPFAVSGANFESPSDIADFVRHAFLHTSCRALLFT